MKYIFPFFAKEIDYVECDFSPCVVYARFILFFYIEYMLAKLLLLVNKLFTGDCSKITML